MSSPRHRPYHPGEDMAKFREGIVVCQADMGRPRGYLPICAKPVQKIGRARFAGGWHHLYECERGHRFGIKGEGTKGSVIEVPRERPVFGGSLGV